MRLGAPATLIEHNSMKFVITYRPDSICTRQYIKDLQQYNTRKLVNLTEVSYNTQMLNVVGIMVEQLAFPDGTFPSSTIIDQWLQIVRQHFLVFPNTTLAVHDNSGLGRSAVMVAIALMEAGMKPQEAIDVVKMRRRGAFNEVQLDELGKYKSKNRLMERQRSKVFGNFRSKKNSSISDPSSSSS